MSPTTPRTSNFTSGFTTILHAFTQPWRTSRLYLHLGMDDKLTPLPRIYHENPRDRAVLQRTSRSMSWSYLLHQSTTSPSAALRWRIDIELVSNGDHVRPSRSTSIPSTDRHSHHPTLPRRSRTCDIPIPHPQCSPRTQSHATRSHRLRK